MSEKKKEDFKRLKVSIVSGTFLLLLSSLFALIKIKQPSAKMMGSLGNWEILANKERTELC